MMYLFHERSKETCRSVQTKGKTHESDVSSQECDMDDIQVQRICVTIRDPELSGDLASFRSFRLRQLDI